MHLRCGVQIAEITGEDDHATGVRLTDGSHLPADAVIIGAGITPNTHLADQAGLKIDNGIWVDEHLRTSHDDVYAAGDVANAYHPLLGRHLRVEHWANALHQGPVAAKSMLGQDAAYDRLPYFFTDQYDLSMEYTGYAEPGGYDQVVIRGDVDSGDVHRLLAPARPAAGRDERQHLGRHRHHRSADQNRPPDRHRPAHRSPDTAGGTPRALTTDPPTPKRPAGPRQATRCTGRPAPTNPRVCRGSTRRNPWDATSPRN